MDDILQDSPSGAQYELSDLVNTTTDTTPVPKGAVRNRAATTAILSGEPDKLIEKYQLLMAEGEQGQSITHDQVMEQINSGNHTKNMGVVMQLLGDKTIPLEQKKKIMKLVQNNGLKQEPADMLRQTGLEQASKGEDLKGESARISLADTMGEINQEAQDRTKMINTLLATHNPGFDAKTIGDLASTEVLPFGRNVIAAKVGSKLDELEGKPFSLGGFLKDFLLPGSAKADIKERLMSIPPAKRGELTQKILGAIKEGASVFPSDNHYAQFVNAVEFLDNTLPSNTEVWTENLMTVLDTFWVGSELKAIGKAGKGAKPAVFDTSKARRPGSANPGVSDAENVVEHAKWEVVPEPFNPFAPQIGNPKARIEYKRADAMKRIELASPVKREYPVAPFNVIEQVNPASARELHEGIVASTSDELAEALTGVGRTQAIANNIYPQVGSESGNVLNKVDQTIKDQVSNTGAIRYTPEEFDTAVEGIKRDFRNASGLEINDAMTTFRVDGDHIIVEGHYATPGGSFLTPDAAREQAKFSLRTYGIRDDEVVVMKREGMEYVPVTNETAPGDYIIKIKTKHAIDDSEIRSWNPLDVKRNWTDRISETVSENKGSVSGWAFDPGSMLHPTLTGSASVAADQSVVLETMLMKPIEAFRLNVKAFPEARRLMVEDYLKEANFKGIRFEKMDLIARGFNDAEIAAVKQWRDIWDNHFYLENYDLVRTLNSQGYQVFDDGATKLFGKPVQKNQNIGNVYDPQANAVRNLPQNEMDALYNLGGSYVKLRRPVSIGGRQVEHIMVRNTPTEYMRKIRDTDQILNYREGYYTVNYDKGSKFVDEISMDSTGAEVRRTVGVAGNTRDAEMFAKAQEASTGNRHMVREDSRGFEKDGDGYWDVNEAAGRIAQRLRGQPLTTASGLNQIGNVGTYVASPLDSASRAARSIAGRTVNRPVLETAKNRFMEQYADMLPSNGMGGKRFPSSLEEIVDHNSHNSKRVADARTTYGYINYLESGLINAVDTRFKGAMNTVAHMLDKIPVAEQAFLKAGQMSPTQAAKRTVFNAYIVGSNPIRQWIVQPHQMTRMIAYNPFGVPGMLKKMVGYIGEYSGFPQASKEIRDFVKFVEDSGMVAGVDRNSLVRGLGIELSDRSHTATRVVAGVRDAAQLIGFDLGEKMNMLGHLAAVHEKWTKKGINLADKTQRDLALSEARALSYDLNRAGELHYTQSSPAALLQFLQMPHKGLLQLANRKIAPAIRMRLAGWDLAMFGVGGSTLYGALSTAYEKFIDDEGILPNDQETRDMFLYGMESFGINWMLNKFNEDGEKSRVDFTALAPNDMDGWARMWHALADDGAFAAWAASPVGQLFAVDGVGASKRNGRIPNAMITIGRYFNVFEELDPENPTEFTSILNDIAKISSGWSAASNAKMMYETRKKLDASGAMIDSTVTIPEVWAAGLGFGTLATKELYMISRNRVQDKKRHEADMDMRYRDILQYYRESISDPKNDINYTQKVTSMLMRSFHGDDLDYIVNKWKRDMEGPQQGLMKQMLDAAGIPDSRRLEDDIKLMPNTSEEEKARLLQYRKDIRQAGEQLKENK